MGFDFTKWEIENTSRTVDALGNPWAELSRDHPDFQRRVVAVIKLKGTKYAEDMARAALKTLSGHDLKPMIGTQRATDQARGG